MQPGVSKKSFFLTLIFVFAGCTTPAPRPVAPDLHGRRVSLMTFNVENLFDTQRDVGREDETYLPLSLKKTSSHEAACNKVRGFYRDECLNLDWNAEVLDAKMQSLAKVILQVQNGQGPDILILPEVENKAVLEQFRARYLSKAGYTTTVLLEGFDPRGIDVGALSRLPLAGEPRLHRISFRVQKPEDLAIADRTRGILEVPLKLPDGTNLTVFGVHFPSGSNPSYMREQAAEFLNQLQKKVPLGTLTVAMGDFNINSTEDSRYKYYKNTLAPQWTVSHLVGCENCTGTNYYDRKDEWSFLDATLFGPGLEWIPGKKGWTLDAKSIRVANQVPEQSQDQRPLRFDAKKRTGVSDHWPLYSELVLVQ